MIKEPSEDFMKIQTKENFQTKNYFRQENNNLRVNSDDW